MAKAAASSRPAPASKLKAYSYLRFSTPEQSKGDSHRRQTEAARAYALANGLELDEELTFADLGVSAFRGDNVEVGKLGEFKEAVRLGLVPKGSFLLVESLDRISRAHARKAQRILEDICESGIIVVTLNDGRRYDSAILDSDPWSMILSLLTFIRANEESATKSSRLKAAWSNKRKVASEGGRPLTALCPGWLTFDKASGKHQVIEEREAIVRGIFASLLRGISPHQIAENLNAEGVPVFGRGKYWHRSYIVKMSSSETVLGTFRPCIEEHTPGGKVRHFQDPIPNYYPAIVSEEDFHAVQALGGKLAPLRGKHAGQALQNLLSGMATCCRCGGTVTRICKGPLPKGGAYLVCARAKVGAGCKYQTVRYDVIELAFLEALPAALQLAPVGADESLQNALYQSEAGIDALRELTQRLLDEVLLTGSSTARARLAEAEEAVRVAEKEHEALETQATAQASQLVLARIAALTSAGLDPQTDRKALNQSLRSVIESIVVDWDWMMLVLKWRGGGESEIAFGFPGG